MAWAPDYVTVDELAAFRRIGDDADDTELAVAITAASRAIDLHCGPNRQFGKVDAVQERVYTARARPDRGRWVVDIDDLMSTTGLVVEVDGTALAGYTLEPRNAAQNGRPWTRLVVDPDSAVQPTGAEYEMAVTALWGWSAVPVAVKQACLLQASRFVSRRDSPFGVAGSPDLGSELRLLAKVDPDVAVSLRPYLRLGGVG